MRRIVLVAGRDPGHALPAIGLAAALRRAGHGVELITGDEHRETAASHGLTVDPLPTLPPDDRDRDFGFRLWGRAPALAQRLVERLAEDPPDVVVTDTLAPAGALIAQLLGRPWIELIPHHLQDPAVDLPPVGLGRRRSRTVLRRVGDRRIHDAQLRSVQVGAEQALAAARAVGLEGYEPPVIRLVATLPSLERRRLRWPASAHVVGPLAADPVLPPLEPPSGSEPLIVVTDSTVEGIGRSLGEVAVVALASLPVRVVVTSPFLAPSREGPLVVGVGAHAPLLEHAALAIGPGGGGFVSKVATAGVPMVVVPLAGDQREAAARLRDTRAGRILPPRLLSPFTLRWAVLRHLADRRARSAALGLAGEAAELGADLAASLVSRVAAGDRPAASSPDAHLGPGSRGSSSA